ncbi:MAG: hypothetical protein PHN90_10445 [Methanothrix sp.]|nr:hypothetical protein [Methanothrix sp.]MDI9397950.1 hypothetical protein [Euryarchaeota archaeon]
MVEPMDFLKHAYENTIDREILECLFSTENWLSVSEITDIVTANLPKENASYPERSRTIRNHLKKLAEKGEVDKKVKDATGQRGRAPEVFSLNKNLRKTIDDYLNTKEIIHSEVIIEPSALGLPPARIVYSEKRKEIGEAKIIISESWKVAPSDGKLYLLRAIRTAKRLGHPILPEEQIRELEKECGVPPMDS